MILLAGWADPRSTSAVAAPFILVNSAAGNLGNPSSIAAVPPQLPIWAAAVVAGSWIGANMGSLRLKTVTIRRLPALVLIIAGVKMILTKRLGWIRGWLAGRHRPCTPTRGLDGL